MLKVAIGILWARFTRRIAAEPNRRQRSNKRQALQHQLASGISRRAPLPPDRTLTRNKRGTETSPLVVKTITAERSAQERLQDAADRDEHASNERWTTRATIVIAIITSVLAFYTALLWRATKYLVEGAEEYEISELSEYIGVLPNNLIEQDREGTRLEAKRFIMNTGQTTAVKVRVVSRKRFFCASLLEQILTFHCGMKKTQA